MRAARPTNTPKWDTKSDHGKRVTVSRDHPVVVKIDRGNPMSTETRNQLVKDQYKKADQIAHTLSEMEKASQEVGKLASQNRKTTKPPFYPAPNKTHVPRKSVRQGYNGSAKKKVDMIPADLDNEMTDWSAKMAHYQDQVQDLNKTVDDLREQLDVEHETAMAMESEALRAAHQQHEIDLRVAEEMRFRGMGYGAVPPPLAAPYCGMPPVHYPAYGPPPGTYTRDPAAYARYFSDLEPRYAHLRRVLSGAGADGMCAQERDAAVRQLGECERINTALRTELCQREATVANLENKTGDMRKLQKAFEDLREQMRVTKANLQKEIKEKHLEVIRKDEEIAQLKSADDIKAATAHEVERVKRSAAADLALTQAAVNNITDAAEQQRKDFKAQHKEARKSLRAASRRIEQLEGQLAFLQEMHDHHENRANDFEARHSQLAQQHQDTSAKHREVLAELVPLRGLRDQLQSTTTDQSHKLKSLEEALNTETKRADTAVSELDALREEYRNHMSGMQGRIQEAETAHDELHNNHGALTVELQAAQEALERQEGVIREQTAKIEDLSAAVSEHRAAQDDLNQVHTETQKALATSRAKYAALEMKAREEVDNLQRELRKAVKVTENLEKIREDQQRTAESKIWDLKEQLDYANSSRRSLQNYATYVRGAYKDVFDSTKPGGESQ